MTDGSDDNIVWLRLDRASLGRLDTRLSRIEARLDRFGSGGGGMDAWQQSVENRLAQLDGHILDLRNEIRSFRTEVGAHFHWLYGILVVAFAAVLGVMARGFDWL
jgi:hypothetical protein